MSEITIHRKSRGLVTLMKWAGWFLGVLFVLLSLLNCGAAETSFHPDLVSYRLEAKGLTFDVLGKYLLRSKELAG